ncbi:MAG: VOC family protein [Allomuricauda sp.]|nr:MAG: VOC family protein [Allomuricauda sp.]
MKENHFVFADLSTYNLETAQLFYSHVFNWEFVTEDGQYYLSTNAGKEIAGLYETPKKFREMNMPSFWMSYIQVDNVEETVAKAKQLGGIVELVELDNPIGGVALIRDPLGAGFTVYDGNQLNSRFENTKNALAGNELFISDLGKIKPFYENLFLWKIVKSDTNHYTILDSRDKTIGNINVVQNEIKGKYEYWGVFFSVEDITTTKQRALDHGGSLIYEDGEITALADPFGAFFHIVPLAKDKVNLNPVQTTKPIKWKALLGLGLVLVYVITEWSWIWGIFFAFWVFMDVRSGQTHLLEPIARKQNPVLYWLVLMMWALLGIYSVYYNTIS